MDMIEALAALKTAPGAEVCGELQKARSARPFRSALLRTFGGERRPGIEYPWSIAHPRRIEDDTAWKARAEVRRSGLR
jgi:hypothetical protein